MVYTIYRPSVLASQQLVSSSLVTIDATSATELLEVYDLSGLNSTRLHIACITSKYIVEIIIYNVKMIDKK